MHGLMREGWRKPALYSTLLSLGDDLGLEQAPLEKRLHITTTIC